MGQNFLVDEGVAAKIADAAHIGPDETVIEIGPGGGVLTAELLARAGRVIAIELDRRLCEGLKTSFAGSSNLELVPGDALKYPYEGLECRVKVVSNLPYYISTPIITRLISARANVALMVLMLQSEVAARVAAPPGGRDYGYLSVMVQLYCEAKRLFDVPGAAFSPVPKVDSAVIRLTVLGSPRADCRDYAFFERVVSAAFSLRRKTLKNALRASNLFSEEGMASLADSGIDPARRAETLSVAEFARLADFLFEFRKG